MGHVRDGFLKIQEGKIYVAKLSSDVLGDCSLHIK